MTAFDWYALMLFSWLGGVALGLLVELGTLLRSELRDRRSWARVDREIRRLARLAAEGVVS